MYFPRPVREDPHSARKWTCRVVLGDSDPAGWNRVGGLTPSVKSESDGKDA